MRQYNTLKEIITLWKYLGKDRKMQFGFLFLLMLISIFTEAISIGAVIPFLSALTNPEILMELEWFKPILRMLHIESADELLLPLSLGFIGVFVFAAFIQIVLLWFNTRLSASMGIQLRNDIYERTLYQSYEFHISHNSSELISMVTEKVSLVIHAGITHVLLLVSALITSMAIIFTLLVINPIAALLAFLVLGGGYVIIGYFVRKTIHNNGEVIASSQPEAVKCMQEGLGGIRDIILDSSHNIFVKLYREVASNIQLAIMRNIFLSGLPKSLIEVIGVVLIVILAYFLHVTDTQNGQVLPILGALALAAQRLLPSLQKIYFAWSTIHGSKPLINEVVTIIETPFASEANQAADLKPLHFNEQIVLKDIKFKYDNTSSDVLQGINLQIKKGSKVGFIGETGSGKSTLLDIIMGLLSPTEGKMMIDEQSIDRDNLSSWQAHISHVPQSIYLIDASISENIAFGVPKDKIDMNKVKSVAKLANIDLYIESLPNGYKTTVGERGVQLSGGQRQRIGIARALYKDANVIVFDEATSALDNITEANVMKAIDALDSEFTLLIIAHRLSTLKNCDYIYELKDGCISEVEV